MSLGTHVTGRWQVVRQPSALFAFPSSHSSPASTTPFPHTPVADDATGGGSLDVPQATRTATRVEKTNRARRGWVGSSMLERLSLTIVLESPTAGKFGSQALV
jgi:hypothetical protein